jgi:vacuolar protein sorting-associated protein 13D
MIGTALLTEARVHSTFAETVTVSGSLGGLQVNNLLPGSALHQRIISVGKEPATAEFNRTKYKTDIHAQLYNEGKDHDADDDQLKQALTFVITQRYIAAPEPVESVPNTPLHERLLPSFLDMSRPTSKQQRIDIELRMASVCYLHSPPFLKELNSCAADFLAFLSQLASSIRSAATDLALGIVQRRTESISHQVNMDETYGTPLKQTSFPKRTGSFRSHHDPFSSLDRRRIMAPASTPMGPPGLITGGDTEVDIWLDAIMETPVLVLPRNERSEEVLVAHLGMITISNDVIKSANRLHNELALPSDVVRSDRLVVKIKDMNVHSVDLTAQIKDKCNFTSGCEMDWMEVVAASKGLTAEELYSFTSTKLVHPILHDTAVEVCLERLTRKGLTVITESESYSSFAMDDLLDIDIGSFGGSPPSTSYEIRAKVINPLKVSLYRSQYELLLDSVHHLFNAAPEQRSGVKQLVNPEPSSSAAGVTAKVDVTFSVPQLLFELCGDGMGSNEGQALVNVQLEDFAIKYSQQEADKSSTEIALGSLVVEDLLLSAESPHRKLATSICGEEGRRRNEQMTFATNPGLSTSCPRLAAENRRSDHQHWQSSRHLSSSLPQNLDTAFDTAPGGVNPRPRPKMPSVPFATSNLLGVPLLPATPPPSMCGSARSSPVFDEPVRRDLQSEENLVHVKVLNVSPTHRDFNGRHNSTHRFIDVDFNTLDIIFNLKSWVMIFDFLGISSPRSASKDPAAAASVTIPRPQQEIEQPHVNSEIDIKVKALSVMLNHSNYEVALASVKTFISRISLRDGNFAIRGTLGKFLVIDLTRKGCLYRDRFLTMPGHDQVLSFNFFKFGLPDEGLKEPYDATLKLRMASIIYVHTQRFYSELMAFFNHFHQHQSVMNRIRVAAMGTKVNETASRGSRIKLDIEAGSPLLLLPMSSSSTKMLVVNLGFLDVDNTFKFAGDEGTISSQTLQSALASQLVSNRRRRSSSRSSRSSVRSRSRQSGIKSPASNVSSAHHSRSRGVFRNVRGGVSTDDDDEGDDCVQELPTKVHKCLLDVMSVSLRSIDLKTAERLSAFTETLTADDIVVGGFVVRQNPQKVLREKCELKLQIERNLDKAFNHQVPDLSINGVLSRVHASVDGLQYQTIRGLLTHNLGENLDDLMQFQVSVPTNEYQDPSMQNLPSGIVWTCLYMNIELQDVIVDLHKEDTSSPALARVNFAKSLLTYESFSDSSRDIDLVSQEILMNDLRFTDCAMNKRPNVFSQILQPINQEGERRSLLQAEVHFRLTADTNRITILVNNMKLMGIFDWWLQILDYISQCPNHEQEEPQEEAKEEAAATEKSRFYLNEEPLYPSAGIVSRRAPVIESKGPVFELKLNITDSDFIIVADPSVADSSAVILRSTTVIAYRPDMVDRPFSCNLNNAEVFSCVLGNEEESALSIIDPVTINFEIAGRNVPGMPSRGLTDLLVDRQDGYNLLGTYERTAEVQLQQLNIRLSYHDWQMFQKILKSFPRQAQEAFQSRGGQHEQQKHDSSLDDVSPANFEQQLFKLIDLGFNKDDCAQALKECGGQLDEAALWLTLNATPESSKHPGGGAEIAAAAQYYLQGTNVSFTNFECKISTVNVCIIDDCLDADVPLLELNLQRLHLHHDFEGVGDASSVLSASYYNRALSSWEHIMEPWRCRLGWRIANIGANAGGQRLVVNVDAEETVNFNLTSTLIELYHMVKTNWTADYYAEGDQVRDRQNYHRISESGVTFRKRVPFVPFALRNDTGCTLWFFPQTRSAGSHLRPADYSRQPSLYMGNNSSISNPQMQWRQVNPGEEVHFSFEESRTSKLRHLNSSEVKIHQVTVRVNGWQEVSPVSVDRVGTYFRKAASLGGGGLREDSLDFMPPARVVFDVTLEGSAMKLVTVRSALLVENRLSLPIELKLENTTIQAGDVLTMNLKPKETKPMPMCYVWARMFARPSTGGGGGIGQWKFSDRPINWYHIMSPSDNSLEVHTSTHLWKNDVTPQRYSPTIFL